MTIGKTNKKPTGFILKRPDSKRKTFQILPYSRIDRKKVYHSTLEHETLTSINERFLRGELSKSEAELHLKKVLIPKLKNDYGMPEKIAVESLISEHNMRVYRDFWNTHYRRKKLENPTTAKNEFLTALRFFEPLSLHSSDIDTMQDHWDKKLKGSRHKRYGGRINQLLEFLNRGCKLNLDRADKPALKWVTWEELDKINEHVRNPILRDLYRSLWGTGCRLGEIFVLNSDDLKPNNAIFICKQMMHNLKIKPYTKNRINHDTIVLPPAIEAFKRWLAIEDKTQYRKRCQTPLIEAARKAFPNDPNKWISPHKLRHSFVRYLTERRVSLNEIKDLIGDTLKTTEDTYAGWIIASDSIDYIMDKIQEAEKLKNKRSI